MHFVCDKCYYQFAHSRPNQAEKLTSQIESIKRLYDDNVISEEMYHHLLKVLISIYIGNQVTTTVNYKLSAILRDRLSPHRILEALALAP